MPGLTTAGAIAGATEEVAKDAAPVVNQAVTQSYEVAFKNRGERAQAAHGRLIANPGDAGAVADFSAVLDQLCADAGYLRTGGVQSTRLVSDSDISIWLDVLNLKILNDERAAASALAK